MPSDLKPITLYGDGGINPVKVSLILIALNLPHKVEKVLLADIKKPEYTAINPNGRLPAIHDPNTGITLWESGAIVEYLVDKYDKDRRVSFAAGTTESYLARQWLHFQVSGQGPYYGQASWFKMFHPEKVPSAIDRYFKEIKRVSGVLNDFLAKQPSDNGGPWLVGNKCSFADMAFLPWQWTIVMVSSKEEYDVDQFPHLKSWLERLEQREDVKSAKATLKKLD